MSQTSLYKFLQLLTATVLVLLNMTTDVPLGERFEESLRARDTFIRTWSRKPSVACIALNAFASLGAIATTLPLLLAFFAPILLPVMPLWWLFKILFLLVGVWPVDPESIDRYGEVAIEWPNTKRTYFKRKLRPPNSPVFKFLEEWLSDPVHIKMLTYMTSSARPQSHVYKLAEENILWQLNSASWEHKTNHLSTRSEELERRAMNRPNLSTLRELVRCHRTTRKLQDGIEDLFKKKSLQQHSTGNVLCSPGKTQSSNQVARSHTSFIEKAFLLLYHAPKRIQSSRTI